MSMLSLKQESGLDVVMFFFIFCLTLVNFWNFGLQFLKQEIPLKKEKNQPFEFQDFIKETDLDSSFENLKINFKHTLNFLTFLWEFELE